MAAKSFVDTSGFYALLATSDSMHRRAVEGLTEGARKRMVFVTSDYVLDETATLLRARGKAHLARVLFDTLAESEALTVEWMSPDRFTKTQTLFLKHNDHARSFTDCFSFVLMKELRIRSALTKDHHFREAGFSPSLV